MGEVEPDRVQHLALGPKQQISHRGRFDVSRPPPVPPISLVADDRMSDMAEMYPDLMCPARFNLYPQQCGFPPVLLHPPS